MTTKPQCCKECGSPQTTTRRGKGFCSDRCRVVFNNRRLQRGADLYDLFRALRRERDEAKTLNIWTEICRLEKIWQDEDETMRPGRRSYIEPRRALRVQRGALVEPPAR